MKDMYSKPTNRTELSIPKQKPYVATVFISLPKKVPERETTRMSLNS